MSVLSFLEEVKRAAYQRGYQDGLDTSWTRRSERLRRPSSSRAIPKAPAMPRGVDDVLDALEKKARGIAAASLSSSRHTPRPRR